MQAVVATWAQQATSWTESTFASKRAQLITTAVVSGSAVAALILAYQASRHQRDVARLKMSIPHTPQPIDETVITHL